MIERDFAAAIAADYGSDISRFVFADWLLDCGEDRRAELIHIQCALERAEGLPRTPELNRLYSRRTQLQPIMAGMLAETRGKLTVSLDFERGLIQSASATAAEFAAEASALVDRVPFFMKLTLEDRVVIVPELSHVRSLCLESAVDKSDLRLALDAAPLYELDLRADHIADDVVAALAMHPAAAGLRDLKLTTISHIGAATLAASTHLAGLKRLTLFRCGGSKGAAALATARWADSIEALVIHKRAVTDIAFGKLYARFGDRVVRT